MSVHHTLYTLSLIFLAHLLSKRMQPFTEGRDQSELIAEKDPKLSLYGFVCLAGKEGRIMLRCLCMIASETCFLLGQNVPIMSLHKPTIPLKLELQRRPILHSSEIFFAFYLSNYFYAETWKFGDIFFSL
jgi:hypothetical protein